MRAVNRLDVILGQWDDMHGIDGAPAGAHNSLRRAMRRLVPESAADAIAAIEVGNEDKAVVVLQGHTLYIAKATAGGDVEVRKEPLDAARISVVMVEPRGEAGRVRNWVFERDGGPFLRMRTRRTGRGQNDDAPDNEPFALALCRTVGWDVPAE
ncbi:MAG TPA: hypothetical protein VHF88_07215 [Thermoleophilaceae bacterium]|nr:hypothetical protein [Thermoleophilaceae bacterium]